MKWTKSKKKRIKNVSFKLAIVLVGFFAMGQLFKLNDMHFSSLSSAYRQDFINQMAAKAESIQENYGILPSIIMGQAILESDWGRSNLSIHSNNYYGIKQTDGGDRYLTQEYTDGQAETVEDSFARYASLEESMEAYAKLLVNGTSWDKALYAEVVGADDYRQAAYALQDAGYATDPNYAQKLINLIEQNKLYSYDE